MQKRPWRITRSPQKGIAKGSTLPEVGKEEGKEELGGFGRYEASIIRKGNGHGSECGVVSGNNSPRIEKAEVGTVGTKFLCLEREIKRTSGRDRTGRAREISCEKAGKTIDSRPVFSSHLKAGMKIQSLDRVR